MIKTDRFADRVIKMCRYLEKRHSQEHDALRQVYRSGTSIGANVHEALYAQSKADFVSKLSISLKEASETSFWLTLLEKTDYLAQTDYRSMKTDVDELMRMIISSLKTIRNNERTENE